jgi:hypothetical protein
VKIYKNIGESYFVEISSNNVDITGQGFQIIKSLLGTEIACAENVMDTSGN